MQKLQKGFTLIELMIVVVIIGILAAIGIPQYQNYTAKAKITSGLAEITAAKSQIEVLKNESRAVPTQVSRLGLSSTPTENCTFAVKTAAGTPEGAAGPGPDSVVCTLMNAPSKASGVIIDWTRTVDATTKDVSWTCGVFPKTDELADLIPKNCVQRETSPLA